MFYLFNINEQREAGMSEKMLAIYGHGEKTSAKRKKKEISSTSGGDDNAVISNVANDAN